MGRRAVWALLLVLGCSGESPRELPGATDEQVTPPVSEPTCALGTLRCQEEQAQFCDEAGWRVASGMCPPAETTDCAQGVPPDLAVLYERFCRTCLPGTVPRCLDVALPSGRASEPPACGQPSCERPLGAAVRDNYGYEAAIELHGTCADGKVLEATLGRLQGLVSYYRNGALVGEATYGMVVFGTVDDCACSGESFAGDALCPSPTFDTPPAGELHLPFADGHRVAPCACVD